MTVRVEYQGRIYGLLSVSIPADLAADEEERGLLREVAGDIAFALYNIQVEEDRQRAKEALRRERDLLRLINETSPVGITVLNREGQVTFANRRAEKVLGLTQDQITQRTYNAPAWRITDYEGQPFPDEALPFNQVMTTGRAVYDVRHAIAWPDGHRVLLSINASPLFDDTGQVDGMVATVDDVTERVRAEEALRESEARFRQVYEHMTVGVARVSLDFRIESANEAYCQMLGYREAALIGKHLRDITHPETMEENLRKQSRLAVGDIDHYRMEKRFIHSSGRVVHGILDANLVRDAEGNPSYFLGSVLDITERKRMEEALRVNEALLRNVIDADPSCIFLKDEDGKFFLVNEAMARLHDTTPEAMVGKTDRDYIDASVTTSQEVENFRRDDLEVMRQGRSKLVPTESFTLPDGTVKWFQTHKVPVFIEGRGDSLLGVAVDITARVQAEEALRESAERFRGIFETSPIGIAIVDTVTQRFLEANDSFLQILGYSLGELQQRTVMDVTHPEDWKRESEIVQAYLDSALPSYVVEKRYIRKDGGIRWVRTTGDVLFIDPDVPPLAIANVEDITERKRAEEALRESEKDLSLAQEVAHIGSWKYNVRTGELHWSDELFRIYGLDPEGTEASLDDGIGMIHPDDKASVEVTFRSALEDGLPYEIEYRIIRPDGEERFVQGIGKIETDAKGDILSVYGTGQDITARKRAEIQLKQALAEKTALVQELYHRTRNNMQVIRAMLHIYGGYVGDARVAEVFEEMEDRIYAMALAHRKLYESQNLSRINLKEYILDLFVHLKESYQEAADNIALVEEMEDVAILIDTAAPCGLVLNEALSNVFKHAFPNNRAGEVRIHLRRAVDGKIELTIADSGIGVPAGFDFRTCKTLGVQNMIAIVEYQLQGEITFETCDGVTCRLRFRDDLYEERV